MANPESLKDIQNLMDKRFRKEIIDNKEYVEEWLTYNPSYTAEDIYVRMMEGTPIIRSKKFENFGDVLNNRDFPLNIIAPNPDSSEDSNEPLRWKRATRKSSKGKGIVSEEGNATTGKQSNPSKPIPFELNQDIDLVDPSSAFKPTVNDDALLWHTHFESDRLNFTEEEIHLIELANNPTFQKFEEHIVKAANMFGLQLKDIVVLEDQLTQLPIILNKHTGKPYTSSIRGSVQQIAEDDDLEERPLLKRKIRKIDELYERTKEVRCEHDSEDIDNLNWSEEEEEFQIDQPQLKRKKVQETAEEEEDQEYQFESYYYKFYTPPSSPKNIPTGDTSLNKDLPEVPQQECEEQLYSEPQIPPLQIPQPSSTDQQAEIKVLKEEREKLRGSLHLLREKFSEMIDIIDKTMM